MLSEKELNERVTRGLRSQFNQERTEAILTQAETLALQAEYQSGNRTANRPEAYELLESGWVDRATELLGYGRWCIGRPKLNGSNGNGLKRNPRPRATTFRHSTPALTNQKQPEPQAQPVGDGWARAIEDLMPSFPLPKSRNWGDNAIVHKKLLVVGAQGKGKTTFMQSHALAVRDFANAQFFGAIERASVRAILTDAVREPSTVWYFASDDLTLAWIDAMDVNSWYQIRHLIAKHTGLRRGLVVTAMGVHRFHGLDVNLGSEFEQLWVKSLPDRPHDRSVILSYFDHIPAYKRKGEPCSCRACEFERMGEPNDKALVRLSDGSAHIVQVPYPREFPLSQLSKPHLCGWYLWLNATIGFGLLSAVGLVFYALIRLWLRG